MGKYICIDIGGTAIKYGILNEPSDLSGVGSIPTNAQLGGANVLKTVCDTASALYSSEPDARGVCVSSAGIIDSESGTVIEANPALMPSYKGVNIKKAVTERTGLPCSIENDVNCAALAEYHHGAARNSSSALILTVGTGIGGAFIKDGKMLSGHTFSACEVGYIHLEGGSFEELAATSILVKRVSALFPDVKEIDGRWVFAMAEEKHDQICIDEINRLCHNLALGISDLCYVLNPEVVVIGGGIAHQSEYLKPLIDHEISGLLIPIIRDNTRITFAENLNHAGMLGAYYHFCEER